MRMPSCNRRRLAALLVFLAADAPALGQVATQPADATLFKNVKVFDGKSDKLTANTSVLVVGNKIEKIGGDIAAPEKATVIDAGGRTLMPGLIDAHWHAMLVRPTPAEALTWDVGYANLVAGAEATDTLLRGFTTVRDVGGPAFGLKRAIDEGLVAGPRIYPSGAVITVTSGHGDFRQPFELPRTLRAARGRAWNRSAAAWSPTARTRSACVSREQLMLGATQIKLTAGGGVASPHSPLDATTFTEPELRAAVEAAENWGTYVTVHAYTPASIQRAIAAGVKCIEHGHLMDEATAKLIAERGVWLSIQPFPDELADAFPPGSQQRAKFAEVFAGTDVAYRMARKHKLKTAWGTDILFSAGAGASPGGTVSQTGTLVHPRRSARHGDRDERRTAGHVREAQPLSRQAGCRGRRRAGRSAAGRWRPPREHQTDRGPGQELRRHHEGRQDLQEHARVHRAQSDTVIPAERAPSIDRMERTP